MKLQQILVNREFYLFLCKMAEQNDHYYRLLYPIERTPEIELAVGLYGKPSEQEIIDEFEFFKQSKKEV